MKYIDADKLKELISQKEKEFIEKSETKGYTTLEYRHKAEGLHLALLFIDSLPDENNPEPYNPVYDEDYLNEKIAKATKSWEGVDVDKMLADCRGYDEEPDESLDEAAEKYSNVHYYETMLVGDLAEGFKAGAEWMAGQGITVTGNTDDEYIRILEDIEEAICEIAPDSTVNIQIRK